MGLPSARPDIELYRLLLEHGRPQTSDGAAPTPHALEQVSSWLSDPDLVDAARLLLAQSARLAQEQVGVELLQRFRHEIDGAR